MPEYSVDEEQLREIMYGIAKRTDDRIEAEVKEQIAGLSDAIEKQGMALRSLGEGGYGSDNTPISKLVADQKKALEGVISGESRAIKFVIPRSAVNKTLITRASLADSTLGLRLPDVAQIPHLMPVMRSLFRSAQIGANQGGIVRYFEQTTVTRNADTRDEGAEKPESVITWTERKMDLEKIADSIPVTTEGLMDIPFMISEIERLLSVNIVLKEDSQLYSGDGVAPNLSGVYTIATAFNAGAYTAPLIDNANVFDLINVLRAQIMSSKQSKYEPNAVLMNPTDLVAFRATKASDGHYVSPSLPANLRLIETNQVTANTLLIGDFRFGTLYDMGGIEIKIGHIDKQFLENKVTILAEERLGLLIKEVDKDAFMKVTDITAAVAALETP